MHPLTEDSALERLLDEQPALLVYFSGPDCGVCGALKPRVAELIASEFPALNALEVDVSHFSQLAARHQVFTVPTLLVFFDGRETIRLARRFSVAELAESLERPYALRFE